MKVLFVSSAKKRNHPSPIIKNQGESLIKLGINVQYYQIIGKGIVGYLKSIPKLRTHVLENNYDIIHAHYALTGIVASLAGVKPLIVSLMGSDVYQFKWLKYLTIGFSRFFWETTIVKSHKMKLSLPYTNPIVLANGVDLDKFKPISNEETKVTFPKKKYPWIIFIGHPTLKEKNFVLAQKALTFLHGTKFEFIHLYGMDNNMIPKYMNAASVLLLTSLWEGSPNVIKEAMACNCPIVSVDVGDVAEIISSTTGCYLTTHSPEAIADSLKEILASGTRTNGRQQVQHLSANLIASELKKIYLSTI